MGMSEADLRKTIAQYIAGATDADTVNVTRMERLGGGAIQENYALDVGIRGKEMAGQHILVLRTDAPSRVSVSLSRAQEFAVLQVAFAAGLTVPEPLLLCTDGSPIGKDFFIMRRAAGSASARELLRSSLPEEAREALVELLGTELARLHITKPPVAALDFLTIPEQAPALARVAQYQRYLDGLPEPHPVIECGLRWLEQHAPLSPALVLCHGDYRTGNLMFDGGELTGILDWEFAGWSDPFEDLGWFCARCWRFGEWDKEAGGIGSRAAFYRGYEKASGQPVDGALVSYWEVMAAVRWAIIALQQAQRHLSGEEQSLELALTGRMVPEMELDMMMQIDLIEERGTVYA